MISFKDLLLAIKTGEFDPVYKAGFLVPGSIICGNAILVILTEDKVFKFVNVNLFKDKQIDHIIESVGPSIDNNLYCVQCNNTYMDNCIFKTIIMTDKNGYMTKCLINLDPSCC